MVPLLTDPGCKQMLHNLQENTKNQQQQRSKTNTNHSGIALLFANWLITDSGTAGPAIPTWFDSTHKRVFPQKKKDLLPHRQCSETVQSCWSDTRSLQTEREQMQFLPRKHCLDTLQGEKKKWNKNRHISRLFALTKFRWSCKEQWDLFFFFPKLKQNTHTITSDGKHTCGDTRLTQTSFRKQTRNSQHKPRNYSFVHQKQ